MATTTLAQLRSKGGELHPSLPPYKSELNRWLILKAQLPHLQIIHPTTHLPEDIVTLQQALQQIASPQSGETTIDLGLCGTCARFVLPLLCGTPGVFNVDGNPRMRQRPMRALSACLQQAGADVQHCGDQELPIRVRGRLDWQPLSFALHAADSSQFLSGLMLLAPRLQPGTVIRVQHEGDTSFSEFTRSLLQQIGYHWENQGGSYQLHTTAVQHASPIHPEADWAALSYWLALSQLLQRPLVFKGVDCNSQQPDAQALSFYRYLGFTFRFGETTRVQPPAALPPHITLDAAAFPDLAPGFAVWFALAGASFRMAGLQRLPFKECDRVAAVERLFEALGTRVQHRRAQHDRILEWQATPLSAPQRPIRCFGDHRMVLAASLLATRFDGVQFDSPNCVAKSYPHWWHELIAISSLHS